MYTHRFSDGFVKNTACPSLLTLAHLKPHRTQGKLAHKKEGAAHRRKARIEPLLG